MKDPREMPAAAINRELDALEKASSKITDEFIAAGRGYERPTDWANKTDPLSMKEKANSSRYAELMREVRRRAGPGMYRLPKGFGPMKNPATRKPGTVAAINRQIDAINRRGKNPARTATLVARKPAAKNPARKTDKRLRVNRTVRSEQWLKFHVQEKRGESDKWTHTAGFHLQSDAERYAKSLHAIRPDMFFRVVSAS